MIETAAETKAPRTKYLNSVEYFKVMADLIGAAEHRGVTTYQRLAKIMGLPDTGHYMGREVGAMLDEISWVETSMNRPDISCLVVNARGVPGDGFFAFASGTGRFDAKDDRTAFLNAERAATYHAWRRRFFENGVEVTDEPEF